MPTPPIRIFCSSLSNSLFFSLLLYQFNCHTQAELFFLKPLRYKSHPLLYSSTYQTPSSIPIKTRLRSHQDTFTDIRQRTARYRSGITHIPTSTLFKSLSQETHSQEVSVRDLPHLTVLKLTQYRSGITHVPASPSSSVQQEHSIQEVSLKDTYSSNIPKLTQYRSGTLHSPLPTQVLLQRLLHSQEKVC